LNGFWKTFKPDQIVKDIQEIDFAKLKKMGINALILDIDDTLIPREVNDIYPQVFEWIMARKEEGFRLCLTSNSRHPLRVKYFGDALGLPAMHLSFKPLPFAFWKSMEILRSDPGETAMIGDQLFMDILGGNLVNLYTIYIEHGKEEIFWLRKWMRQAEAWVLSKLSS
jgi:hypothetical protein